MNLAVFDQICYQFETIATGGVPAIKGLVMATFWMLATIDACMAFLTNLDDGDHFKILIQKCLKIGFWLFLLNNWGMFCSVIKNSFIMAGSVMGSGGGLGLMQHPSVIVAKGLTSLDPILNFEASFSGMTRIMSNFQMVCAGLFAYLLGCIAYVILGVQVVVTYVEFYLVCALLTIFVPFGVTKWTSFLAEKAIGGVIGYGVKLMVLSCLVSIIPDVINSYAPMIEIKPDNAITAFVSLASVAVLLAFLAWQAPALAASVMTGGPSLTASNAISFAAIVGAATIGTSVAGLKGLSAAAKGITSNGGGNGGGVGNMSAATSVGDVGSSVAGGGASAAASNTGGSSSQSSPTFSSGGTTSYGGNSTSSAPANGSSSSSSAISSDGGGSTKGSSFVSGGNTGQIVKKGGSTGSGESSSSISSSSNAANVGDNSSSVGGGGSAGTTPSEIVVNGNNGGQNKSPSFSGTVGKITMTRNMVPQDASPQGGMSAPIRD